VQLLFEGGMCFHGKAMDVKELASYLSTQQ